MNLLKYLLIFFLVILILGLFFYAFNLVILFNLNSIIQLVVNILFFLSILMCGIFSIGYLRFFIKSVLFYESPNKFSYSSPHEPETAVFIPIFNEDPEIVERTAIAALKITFRHFKIFFLDDSTDLTKKTLIHRIAEKYSIEYLDRRDRKGFKAGAINDALKLLPDSYEYLLLLDADQIPEPNIISDIIPLFINDENLAFVQTHQKYKYAFDENYLKNSYSIQQHIFYKHVCRGLNTDNSVFMGGSGVVIRIRYLHLIAGMDEDSITEDLSTSFKFHIHGYKTQFLDKIYTHGMAPSSLNSYFAQQTRYAFGTMKQFKKECYTLVKRPGVLTTNQWINYLVFNGCWYFQGWTSLFWLVIPIISIFLHPEHISFPGCNLILLFYLLNVSCICISNYFEQGYRITDQIIAQSLFFCQFPIFIKASIMQIRQKKLGFIVTPKLKSEKIHISDILPQFLILILSIFSLIYYFNISRQDPYPGNNFYLAIWITVNSIMILIFLLFFVLNNATGRTNYEEI